MPSIVGMPEMIPVFVSRVSPGGSGSTAIHVKGGLPTVGETWSWCMYASPTIAFGRSGSPQMTPPARISIEPQETTLTCAGSLESRTVISISKTPSSVGTPLISPVSGLIVSPGGRLTADHISGSTPFSCSGVQL